MNPASGAYDDGRRGFAGIGLPRFRLPKFNRLTVPYGRGVRGPMLYVVEIQRDRELFAMAMSAIREWLDAQRFEPEIFRCDSTEALVTFRLEFNQESEAAACADAFGGQRIR
jgi:hypothetical protein